MKIIGVVTQKGGAGKTSLAMNLACVYGMFGIETRLIDLDPQESATKWGRSAKGAAGNCMMIRDGIRKGFRMDTDVIPVSQDADALRSALEGQCENVERIIVDTPPTLDKPPAWVAARADIVLVPIEPDLLSVRPAKESIILLKAIQQRRGGLPHIFIVPNKIEKTKLSQTIQEQFVKLGNITPPLPFTKSIIKGAVATGTHIYATWHGRKFASHVAKIMDHIEEFLK